MEWLFFKYLSVVSIAGYLKVLKASFLVSNRLQLYLHSKRQMSAFLCNLRYKLMIDSALGKCEGLEVD